MANSPLLTTETDKSSLGAITAAIAEAAPEVAASSRSERARWLVAVAAALDDVVDGLVSVADAETALGDTRLRGEVARTTGQLRLFARVIGEGSYLEATIDHADTEAVPPRPDLRRMLHPIGPVAVFAASNFPFAFSVAGGDTASALAAGCPVVVKGHSGHPELSALTAEAVQNGLLEAGAPRGAFALIGGREAGRSLVKDPAIRAVGFTGSLDGGKALFDLANARPDPIPFYGELSSLNPVVITRRAAQARADELATGLVGSFTLGVGQFCTKPGLVFVPMGAGFEEAVAAAVEDAPSGRMLNDRIADDFARSLQTILTSGEIEIIAGDPSQATSRGVASPVVVATSGATLMATSRLAEECFGPFTLLVRYSDENELAEALASVPGSLTATVHAEPEEHEDLGPLLDRLRQLAGRVILGGWPTGVSVSWAQHHGGPWPSTTSPLHTSVGASAIRRFLRPIAYQNVPRVLLPAELREGPVEIPRRIDGLLVPPER